MNVCIYVCVCLMLLKVINHIVKFSFKGLYPSVKSNAITLPSSVSITRPLILTPKEHLPIRQTLVRTYMAPVHAASQ